MSKGILIILLLCIYHKVECQKLIAQHFTMANGLPSNEIFSILKDKKGLIWLGTDKGLCKFDGKTFKTFTINEGLSENTILEVKEDKLGRIWCRGFLGSFSIVDNDSSYPIKFNTELKRIFIENQLYQFELDDSLNLYIATRNNGLVYKATYPYNNINVIKLPKNFITFFQINNTKNLISYNNTLNSVDKNWLTTIALRNKVIQIPTNLAGIKQSYFLRYIYTSEYLIFSTDNIIHKISLVTKKISTINVPFRVSTLALLADSTCIVGGFQGEIYELNIKNSKLKILDKFSSSISKIYCESNTCWITTLNDGIYYIPNLNYNMVYQNREQLISMLPVANDSLYILNSNSESTLLSKNKKEILPNYRNQKTLMYWQHFDQSQKKIIPLVGCFNYMIERSTRKKIYYNFIKHGVWNQTEFVVPIESLIYASFYGGIKVFNNNGKQVMTTIASNIRTTCMYGNNGILYLGSLQGMYKLENNIVVPLDTHSFFKFRVEAIDKIGEDSLVIATQSKGIGIYNLKTKQLTEFNKNIGLDKLNIQYVQVDDKGKIWIATQQSIHVLKVFNTNTPILLDVVDLMIGDLAIKEVRILNEVVYILAGNNVLKIPENLIKFNTNPFPIILNEFIINDKISNYINLKSLDLLPNENNLLFKYQLLTYTQNNQIEYRYQLNNEPWIYTSNNELQLASLPSKEYNIIIQGRLKNGPWSENIMINFNIKKPFYKTSFFIFATICFSLILLYLYIIYYLRKKIKQKLNEFELKRELESARLVASKSQMNPHFIFNALSSIQNFIIKSDKIKAYQYLTDFSTLIRDYLQYSNKDYIKLDKELELIQTYIKIEQLRIAFNFEIEIGDNINTNEEYIFTLLLQPCLENAIWHGLNHKKEDKKILIKIFKTNNII